MLNKKTLFILELLLIVIGLLYFTIKDAIPAYKSNFGSSDKFINTSKYKNLIEVRVDNRINFGLIINDNNKIYDILFFDKSSICLYNQNIENKDLEKSLDKIITILIENNYLKANSIIDIIRYNDEDYREFISEVTALNSKYKINPIVNELEKSLEVKGKELGLSGSTDNEILQSLDFYSKQLVSNFKNNISNNKKDSSLILTALNSRTLSDNVYKKIENYISVNNLNDLDKGNNLLIITSIPADSRGTYYPTSNSWYYTKNKKTYAFIELSDGSNYYRYCYNGTVDAVKEGTC